MSSWELGVLFQPQKITRRHRVFSCTPDHPILGMAEAAAPRAPVSADHFVLEYQHTPAVSHAKRRRIDGEAAVGDEPEIVDLEPVALPLPHQLPPRKYTADDVPWVWDRNYLDPDITGEVWLPGGVAGEDT